MKNKASLKVVTVFVMFFCNHTYSQNFYLDKCINLVAGLGLYPNDAYAKQIVYEECLKKEFAATETISGFVDQIHIENKDSDIKKNMPEHVNIKFRVLDCNDDCMRDIHIAQDESGKFVFQGLLNAWSSKQKVKVILYNYDKHIKEIFLE